MNATCVFENKNPSLSQLLLGFLFSKMQVAFMYDYRYRVEWMLLKRSWFVLPTSIKYVSKQKNV